MSALQGSSSRIRQVLAEETAPHFTLGAAMLGSTIVLGWWGLLPPALLVAWDLRWLKPVLVWASVIVLVSLTSAVMAWQLLVPMVVVAYALRKGLERSAPNR